GPPPPVPARRPRSRRDRTPESAARDRAPGTRPQPCPPRAPLRRSPQSAGRSQPPAPPAGSRRRVYVHPLVEESADQEEAADGDERERAGHRAEARQVVDEQLRQAEPQEHETPEAQ